MRLSTALSCLLLAILTGCCTTEPPAGPLILTAEDMRLKRIPYQPSEIPCAEYTVTHTHTTVTYSK